MSTHKKSRDALKGKSKTQIDAAIEEWVLSDVARKIMKASMIDGTGYERIAEDIGVSQKTVQRAVNEGADLVLKNL